MTYQKYYCTSKVHIADLTEIVGDVVQFNDRLADKIGGFCDFNNHAKANKEYNYFSKAATGKKYLWWHKVGDWWYFNAVLIYVKPEKGVDDYFIPWFEFDPYLYEAIKQTAESYLSGEIRCNN